MKKLIGSLIPWTTGGWTLRICDVVVLVAQEVQICRGVWANFIIFETELAYPDLLFATGGIGPQIKCNLRLSLGLNSVVSV